MFTSDQNKVVHGVLDGKFEVGFVRTDEIQRAKDDNGTLLDPNLFKVIDPLPNLNIDGIPFPFESSTPLYPEWNLAALKHVPDDVSLAVQAAMLALADHASVATEMATCMQTYNNTEQCQFDNFTKARCDTTQQVAEIALEAGNKGSYSAWTTTLSYLQLWSLHEATGYIKKDPADNIFKCTRSTTLFESITCPNGYYKASEEEINNGCNAQGLQCEEGFQCLCSPCMPVLDCNRGLIIHGTCVPYSILMPSVVLPFFLVCAICVHLYVEYRRKQADSLWEVRPEELIFDSPPTVIGRGTFGYVILAEYRGTKVRAWIVRFCPPTISGHRVSKHLV